MRNLLFSFLIFLLNQRSLATPAKLSNEALKLYDQNLEKSEESQCLKNKASKDFIVQEIKKISGLSPNTGVSSKNLMAHEIKLFKIDDKPKEAVWQTGSLDTKGEILKAPMVDLNACTPLDIQKKTALENKIWLVEETSAIPDLLALTLEAKLHKALGLIIYGSENVGDTRQINLALPILRISKISAENLKAQMKKKSSSVEFALVSDKPLPDWISLEAGSRAISLGIIASNQDCKAISILLTLLDWQKKSGLALQGTTFAFLSGDSTSVLGRVATVMKIDPSKFKFEKFLKDWLKTDDQIAEVIDGKSVIKRALNEAESFRGLIDKDVLSRYKEDLRSLETVVKIKPDVAYRLKLLFESDDLPPLALDLKNLKLVHDLAQKGQWEKAVIQFRKIHDYQWATNVSASTFLEYRRLTQKDFSVSSALWGTLQKGRNSLDGFIEAVEGEIDRLEQLLSDNFFKIHKSVENLDKI